MTEKRILIVEDDSLLALVLCKHLQMEGYTTFSFARAESFFEFIQSDSDPIYCVLLDVKLKGSLTGVEISKKIPSSIPIVFCTGNSEIESVIGKNNKQVKGILSKPVDMSQLTHLLNSLGS